jgi:hypothetical protein
MTESSFREFEAQSLFCPRCRRAVAVRKKLLLVLPTGNQYDYVCQDCGTAVGGKVDRDATAFHETSRAATAAARPRPRGDGAATPRPPRRG